MPLANFGRLLRGVVKVCLIIQHRRVPRHLFRFYVTGTLAPVPGHSGDGRDEQVGRTAPARVADLPARSTIGQITAVRMTAPVPV